MSLVLSACTGSSGPGSASASRTAGPVWPAWMGDTNKTDVTPADRAVRLSALKTDRNAYLGNLQQSDWVAKNCQTGKIRISHTDMWRQEMANVKKDKTLNTTMNVIVKNHKLRVTAIGGANKLCQVYIGRGVSHQKKLFINVTGLPG